MPTAWRLVKTRHAQHAFDGEGARQFGGRWNSLGTPVIYCSESLALAALELLVHLQFSQVLKAYTAFRVGFPDTIVTPLDEARLPDKWRDYPPPPELQRFGDDWVAAGRSAVLRVPSAVVEHEYNYLLNPSHPEFANVSIGDPQPFQFDPRLAKSQVRGG